MAQIPTKIRPETFASFSFGCRVNQAEIEAMNLRLAEADFKYDEKAPDIYIINTCAVTNKAEREARQKIYQLRRKFPKIYLVVTGCSATHWNKLKRYQTLPVDLFLTNKDKDEAANKLIALFDRGDHQEAQRIVYSRSNFDKMQSSGRALIKIQDGCHRFCSYCIVPYLRGLPKSTPIEKIVSRITSLDSNTKEVILTAINTEAFGQDTGENFTDLLRAVIEKSNIPRISMGSVHPWSVDEKFLDFYKKYASRKRLVNFFHIPLQSGSDKVLELMKRGYKSSEFEEKLARLQKINPQALIATDVIVGFLGENDKEFENTYQFLKKSPISKFHIFRYSKRTGTAADYLSRRIKEPDQSVKIKRAKKLRQLGDKKYNKFINGLVGLSMTALFLGNKKEEHSQALLENQVPIWIKTSKNLNGEIRNVIIESHKNSLLFGKII